MADSAATVDVPAAGLFLAERSGVVQLRDPILVVAQHLGEHLVGVLSEGRRLPWPRQLAIDDLDREGQLVSRYDKVNLVPFGGTRRRVY